jgi:hypothetical protein
MLDVRKPIGYLFVIIGALLVIYGLVQPQITQITILATGEIRSFNLDLPWGAVMFVFGAAMLVLTYMEARKSPSK